MTKDMKQKADFKNISRRINQIGRYIKKKGGKVLVIFILAFDQTLWSMMLAPKGCADSEKASWMDDRPPTSSISSNAENGNVFHPNFFFFND